MLNTPAKGGRLHALRVRWFGERDAVADQLHDIARQGSGMARLAHLFAFLLIILFSLGSLVALAGDALNTVVAGWEAGRVDIPSSISVGVSLLLVPCMDVAMLYAASMLRLLATRQATRRDMLIHMIVLGGVAVVESATYVYMAWEYEHPATIAAWALVIARALAAPLVGVYLSMARPLPVTPRDIFYQVELASGGGLLRNVVTVAHDPAATMHEKAALYDAAAVMAQPDRERMQAIMRAAQARGSSTSPSVALVAASRGATQANAAPPDLTTPPTGPGTPSSTHLTDEASDQAGSGAADSLTDQTGPRRRVARRVAPIRIRAKAADEALETQRQEFVNGMLDNDSELTPNALANAIEAAKLGKCGWHTAARYKSNWQRRQRNRMQVAQ